MRIHSQALVADDAPAPLQDPDVQCTNQFILVDLCSVLRRSFGCPHLLIGLMIAGDCATYRVVVVVVDLLLLVVVVLPSLVCHVFLHVFFHVYLYLHVFLRVYLDVYHGTNPAALVNLLLRFYPPWSATYSCTASSTSTIST